ncbi:PstS family phosphate ABC transporter substrate-binding protein [Mucilaginibacter gossypii]|uniref:Phosphate ABC transporter substrate-binding protein, PhoT family n=1 Tax=Mucilaginibacter gossypii TaxID=551996 RepID=A0A1G8M7B7_9SPHI|nr:substrate-binding domain-containing protein [Mucilaginibacter gossypii]SDI63737.1 phosphate ABC transporter substrate-binding protein, PhoT family [Mucilaginibacter gossypii]
MKIKLGVVYVLVLIVLIAALQACKQKQVKSVPTDSFNAGRATFVADESFSPIVAQEEYVYRSRYPNADPVFIYKTENQAVNMLLNDSVRLAVLSRRLDTAERNIITRRTLSVEEVPFAVDAITLIVNKASNDTAITVAQLKKELKGQGDGNKTIVFDNPNSSLVRYLKDFSGNKEFKQKNIYALKSNIEVIKYVSEHPDALGIIGFSWINNPEKEYADYVEKVKVVGVRDEGNKQYPIEYFKPSQESLVLKQYPLSRSLYLINCSSKNGLAAGFVTFLASDVGQRIILKSGLLPDSIPPREIILKK